jgi:hypothetical protein
MVRRGPATTPSARSTGAGSANQPTSRRAANTRAVSGSSARKAALRELLAAAQERLDRGTDTRADRWAFRYLESSRRLGQIPPAMSPTESHKLAEEQADMLVGVIWAVLDGPGLSDEEWEKGRLLAEKALRDVAEEGWSPL